MKNQLWKLIRAKKKYERRRECMMDREHVVYFTQNPPKNLNHTLSVSVYWKLNTHIAQISIHIGFSITKLPYWSELILPWIQSANHSAFRFFVREKKPIRFIIWINYEVFFPLRISIFECLVIVFSEIHLI